MTKQTDSEGNVNTTQYDLAGRAVSSTDPRGNTTVTDYDNAGRDSNFKEKSELLMKMTLQGYTLPQIAERLYISEEDVFTLADMIGRNRKNTTHNKVI